MKTYRIFFENDDELGEAVEFIGGNVAVQWLNFPEIRFYDSLQAALMFITPLVEPIDIDSEIVYPTHTPPTQRYKAADYLGIF